MESILVSGAPHCKEGKLLCVTKLVDEEGIPTSTGAAQADAVMEQVESWGLNENFKAFVFDTTASNSGVKKEATVRLMLAPGILFFPCHVDTMSLN